MVGGYVAVLHTFSLAPAPAAGELVPDGSVHGVVPHVQPRDGHQAARRAQQLLGKTQTHVQTQLASGFSLGTRLQAAGEARLRMILAQLEGGVGLAS